LGDFKMKKIMFYALVVITAIFISSCITFKPRVKENKGDSEFISQNKKKTLPI